MDFSPKTPRDGDLLADLREDLVKLMSLKTEVERLVGEVHTAEQIEAKPGGVPRRRRGRIIEQARRGVRGGGARAGGQVRVASG